MLLCLWYGLYTFFCYIQRILLVYFLTEQVSGGPFPEHKPKQNRPLHKLGVKCYKYESRWCLQIRFGKNPIYACLALNPCTQKNISGTSDKHLYFPICYKINRKILITGKFPYIKFWEFWDFPEVRSIQYIHTLLTYRNLKNGRSEGIGLTHSDLTAELLEYCKNLNSHTGRRHKVVKKS